MFKPYLELHETRDLAIDVTNLWAAEGIWKWETGIPYPISDFVYQCECHFVSF